MRLLFLCLVAGEIGFAFFCYYRQINYHSNSYAWTGLIYSVLPILLTFIEPEENLPFQELVLKKLTENNISYEDIRFSGDHVAFTFCQETKMVTVITPDDQDQTVLILRQIPISEISKIAFGETLDGWKIQINDELTYILKQTRLIRHAMARWEDFFKQANVPVTVTYEDTINYWVTRSLGVTLSIPAVLLILLSF